MSDNHGIEETVSFIDNALKDREVLIKWVIGLVEGCEGCIEEATSWVESQGEHGAYSDR